MAIFIQNEANRCLNCKKPMCQQGCPIHTPIPEIIQLFKENKLMEAGEKLFENNPMSVICATVCNHEMQCSGHCVLGRKGSPVHFPAIERFISDAYLDRMVCTRAPSKGVICSRDSRLVLKNSAAVGPRSPAAVLLFRRLRRPFCFSGVFRKF